MAKPTSKDFEFVRTYTSSYASKKNLIIILDAAHGCDVSGKCSPDKSHYEYVWSREMIKILKPMLIALGYKVYETNQSAKEIGLTKRKNIADSIQGSPKLLLSLHNNAASCSEWSSASGMEFFTTKGQTYSDIFAECLYKEMSKTFPAIKMRCDNRDGDKDKEEQFTVLTGKSYYACLAEILFMDCKGDVALLKSRVFNEQCSKAIINSIELFNTFLMLK